MKDVVFNLKTFHVHTQASYWIVTTIYMEATTIDSVQAEVMVKDTQQYNLKSNKSYNELDKVQITLVCYH